MRFFFTHKLIPSEFITYDIAGITITSHGFSDVRSFIYYFNVKILIISLLSIWFVSSIHWWRYAIISGIILNTYQLWEGFQENLMLIDEAEYFYSLPYIILLITILIVVSETTRYHSRILILYQGICAEVEEILKENNLYNSSIQERRNNFMNLKSNIAKNGVSISCINDLKKLRQELIREINSGS